MTSRATPGLEHLTTIRTVDVYLEDDQSVTLHRPECKCGWQGAPAHAWNGADHEAATHVRGVLDAV